MIKILIMILFLISCSAVIENPEFIGIIDNYKIITDETFFNYATIEITLKNGRKIITKLDQKHIITNQSIYMNSYGQIFWKE